VIEQDLDEEEVHPVGTIARRPPSPPPEQILPESPQIGSGTPAPSPPTENPQNLISFDDMVNHAPLSMEEERKAIDLLTPPDEPPPRPSPVQSPVLPIKIVIPKRNTEDGQSKAYRMVVVDEMGRQSTTLSVTQEYKTREETVHEFYESKMKQLLQQMKLLDKKAMQIYSARSLTVKQLKECTEERDGLDKKILALQQQLEDLKEDSESTKVTLEQQLSVFSEHISNQKDVLSKLQDEIDNLKSHRVFCGKCKTWNTVGWLLTEGKNGQRCSKGNHGSYYNYISL